MARPRRKLRWVKFDIDRLLFGTTREELEADERSVWYDLILLAGQANEDGWIIPPVRSLPRILNTSPELLERALAKCIEYGKIELDGDRVCVVNFRIYNPQRWERQYYRNDRNLVNSVENSTIEQNSSRKGPEESRGDKKRIEKSREDAEEPEKPWQLVLRQYEQSFGPLGQPHHFERFLVLWDDYPVVEMHDYARSEMMEAMLDEHRRVVPNLTYYARCLGTVAARDYVEVEK